MFARVVKKANLLTSRVSHVWQNFPSAFITVDIAISFIAEPSLQQLERALQLASERQKRFEFN